MALANPNAEERQRQLTALNSVPEGSTSSAYLSAFAGAGGQRISTAQANMQSQAAAAQALYNAINNPNAAKTGVDVGGFQASPAEVKRYQDEMKSGKIYQDLSASSKRIADALKTRPFTNQTVGTSTQTGDLTSEQIKQLLVSRGMTNKEAYETQYNTLPENVKKRLPPKWE